MLAFLAYLDDAEISCGRALIHLAAGEWEVYIAIATSGDWSSPLWAYDIAEMRRACLRGNLKMGSLVLGLAVPPGLAHLLPRPQ